VADQHRDSPERITQGSLTKSRRAGNPLPAARLAGETPAGGAGWVANSAAGW
jgi:hypothetical protein